MINPKPLPHYGYKYLAWIPLLVLLLFFYPDIASFLSNLLPTHCEFLMNELVSDALFLLLCLLPGGLVLAIGYCIISFLEENRLHQIRNSGCRNYGPVARPEPLPDDVPYVSNN
jgi:hypothetical protein